MARSISHVAPGETVSLLFKGSASLGNAPYVLDGLVLESITPEKDRAIFNDNGDTFEVYKFGGRWCYGTSAEKVVVA